MSEPNLKRYFDSRFGWTCDVCLRFRLMEQVDYRWIQVKLEVAGIESIWSDTAVQVEFVACIKQDTAIGTRGRMLVDSIRGPTGGQGVAETIMAAAWTAAIQTRLLTAQQVRTDDQVRDLQYEWQWHPPEHESRMLVAGAKAHR